MLHWPLHGTPETIVLPEQFAQEGIADMKRAAEMMCAKVEIVPRVSLEGRSRAVALRDTLPKEAALTTQAHMRENAPLPGILVQLLDAMRSTTFSDAHRAAQVPYRMRRWNVAMAGSTTPVAGYLLPIIAETTVDSDGSVVLQGQRYRPHLGTLMPHQLVKLRAFPFAYPKVSATDPDPGIFADDGITTHYLSAV
jgi:hypothetical protein